MKQSKATRISSLLSAAALLSGVATPHAFALAAGLTTASAQPAPTLKDAGLQAERSSSAQPLGSGAYEATHQAEQNAFFASDYTYEDASALASLWGQSIDETKARMGRKILWGGENIQILNDYLAQATPQAGASGSSQQPLGGTYEATHQAEQNAFFASDYTYEDASALASLWGQSIDETKARMGRKILWGDEAIQILNDYLAQATPQAGASGPGQKPNQPAMTANDSQAKQDAFFASGYTYDDAALLANFWGESINDAKTIIGEKLTSGGQFKQKLAADLQAAESQASPSSQTQSGGM